MKSKNGVELFELLSEKIRPQQNRTILSLQYCKLIREQSQNADEWMGHIRMKANTCQYKENKRRKKNNLLMV